MAMAANGVVSQHWIGGFDALPPSHNDEVHVLAVDDSIVDRKVIEHLLKKSSCKVTAVDSGIRALQFLGLDEECSSVGLDGLKVDLIITDYCMPGMTGYELLKKIKESSALKEIPVVIMSSENIMTRIDRCLEEGAEDFIVKPVKLSDVKRIKGFMSTREIKSRKEEKGNNVNKRKSRDTCSEISSSPPSMSSSLSSSPLSFSKPSSPSRSPSPSPTTSVLSLSAPCSPTRSLDSPTRRVKMSGSDDDL